MDIKCYVISLIDLLPEFEANSVIIILKDFTVERVSYIIYT